MSIYAYVSLVTKLLCWKFSSPTEQFILVYWMDEESVSVVDEESVEGVKAVGEMCSVKLGKTSYSGKTAAVGKSRIRYN